MERKKNVTHQQTYPKKKKKKCFILERIVQEIDNSNIDYIKSLISWYIFTLF